MQYRWKYCGEGFERPPSRGLGESTAGTAPPRSPPSPPPEPILWPASAGQRGPVPSDILMRCNLTSARPSQALPSPAQAQVLWETGPEGEHDTTPRPSRRSAHCIKSHRRPPECGCPIFAEQPRYHQAWLLPPPQKSIHSSSDPSLSVPEAYHKLNPLSTYIQLAPRKTNRNANRHGLHSEMQL